MNRCRSTNKGWAALAAAIIMSGKYADDERFLQSDWCQSLTDMVSLYKDMYERSNKDVRNVQVNV